MLRRPLFLLLTTVILHSCEQSKDLATIKKVIIDPYEAKDEINLSEFVDSIQFIKLETNSDIVMGQIHSLFIKEKYIYVHDIYQQAVFVFNLEGGFVAKLDKQGKGPGEYRHIDGVVVDNDEEYIEIFSKSGSGNKLGKYSNVSFQLLEEKEELPSVTTSAIRKKENYYYFATQQLENFVNGENTNAGVLVLNGDQITKTLFDKKIETDGSFYSYNGESFSINDSGDLFVSIMFDNTFYRLEKEDAVPVLAVDFGQHGIDNSIGLKSSKEQQQYLKDVESAAFFPVLDINNSNIMSISYNFKDNSEHAINQYIHLKKSDRVLHTRKFKNDITSFPQYIKLCSYCAAFNHDPWYKDFLVAVINPPFHLIQEEKNEVMLDGIGKIEVGDNPVIMLMRLRE